MRTTHEHIAADLWRRQQRKAERPSQFAAVALGLVVVTCVAGVLAMGIGAKQLHERDARRIEQLEWELYQARGHRDMLLAEESRRMTMHLRASEN